MSRSRAITVGDLVGGRYLVDAVLGEGGMAVVFRARHTGTHKVVALKVIHAHLAARPGLVQRFVQEARVGARIGSSPYIVEVFDSGLDDAKAVPFLAMELLTGESLQQMLDRGQPLPPDVSRAVLEQVAEALDQAHANGVVHRDLKPSNLFVGRDARGRVVTKVLDFGIAKLLEGDAGSTATEVGTPAYAAPEQLGQVFRDLARGQGIAVAREITPATDVWAFGLLAYEVLTGSGPGQYWGATTASDLSLRMALSLRERPKATERAAARAAHLPPGFDEWLSRCMEIDASRRWQRAGQAAAALLPRLGAARPVAAPPAGIAATALGPIVATFDAGARGAPGGGPAPDRPAQASPPGIEPAALATAMAASVRTYEAAPTSVPAPASATPLAELPPAPPKTRTRALVVAICAALALGGGGLWAWRSAASAQREMAAAAQQARLEREEQQRKFDATLEEQRQKDEEQRKKDEQRHAEEVLKLRLEQRLAEERAKLAALRDGGAAPARKKCPPGDPLCLDL
jgi:serine/threonine-protein kinase